MKSLVWLVWRSNPRSLPLGQMWIAPTILAKRQWSLKKIVRKSYYDPLAKNKHKKVQVELISSITCDIFSHDRWSKLHPHQPCTNIQNVKPVHNKSSLVCWYEHWRVTRSTCKHSSSLLSMVIDIVSSIYFTFFALVSSSASLSEGWLVHTPLKTGWGSPTYTHNNMHHDLIMIATTAITKLRIQIIIRIILMTTIIILRRRRMTATMTTMTMMMMTMIINYKNSSTSKTTVAPVTKNINIMVKIVHLCLMSAWSRRWRYCSKSSIPFSTSTSKSDPELCCWILVMICRICQLINHKTTINHSGCTVNKNNH